MCQGGYNPRIAGGFLPDRVAFARSAGRPVYWRSDPLLTNRVIRLWHHVHGRGSSQLYYSRSWPGRKSRNPVRTAVLRQGRRKANNHHCPFRAGSIGYDLGRLLFGKRPPEHPLVAENTLRRLSFSGGPSENRRELDVFPRCSSVTMTETRGFSFSSFGRGSAQRRADPHCFSPFFSDSHPSRNVPTLFPSCARCAGFLSLRALPVLLPANRPQCKAERCSSLS